MTDKCPECGFTQDQFDFAERVRVWKDKAFSRIIVRNRCTSCGWVWATDNQRKINSSVFDGV